MLGLNIEEFPISLHELVKSCNTNSSVTSNNKHITSYNGLSTVFMSKEFSSNLNLNKKNA